jgi:hypothetical protein
VYGRYNKATALGNARVDWGEFCVFIFNLYEEVSVKRIGF